MSKKKSSKQQQLPFEAEALRKYILGTKDSAEALLNRCRQNPKPSDAEDLSEMVNALMHAHYELSVAPDALTELDRLIGVVARRAYAYNSVFGTEVGEDANGEWFYSPSQRLGCDKDEDIPF